MKNINILCPIPLDAKLFFKYWDLTVQQTISVNQISQSIFEHLPTITGNFCNGMRLIFKVVHSVIENIWFLSQPSEINAYKARQSIMRLLDLNRSRPRPRWRRQVRRELLSRGILITNALLKSMLLIYFMAAQSPARQKPSLNILLDKLGFS